jgi:hypothetical protein
MKLDLVTAMKRASLLLLLVAFISPLRAAEPVLPLKVSDNRRHLVDQRGAPFLYQADTPWMLFVKLTEAEAKEYIATRKAQGFNALQVMVTGFFGMTNRAGDLPFAGVPPEQDFAQPNEAFFAHVDRVVEEARGQGVLLAIAPAWSDCCGVGWAGKEKDGTPMNLIKASLLLLCLGLVPGLKGAELDTSLVGHWDFSSSDDSLALAA